MANRNDFIVLRKKSIQYFNLLEKEVSFSRKVVDEEQKARIGFYFLILESLSGNHNLDELALCMTDTDFHKYYTNTTCDDCGIDAVLINNEAKTISLFNFKYREKFKPGNMQGLNETLISSKYTNAILQENIGALRGKPREWAKKIIACLNSNEVWQLQLYVVSNDDQTVNIQDMHLQCMKDAYDLDIIPIGLKYITDMMSIRPEPINASLVLDHNAIMSYSENELSSSMSYIARVKLSELIRISCNDKYLRDEYNIEDLSKLSSIDLNYDILFDNVRGFVTKSKYNDNIYDSLKNSPSNFFMFNNGVTVCAGNIVSKTINGKKKQKIDLKDIQILNGGQTLRTIHHFNSISSDNMEEYLSEAEVLVRFFVAENDDYKNKIAEYTNSQNAISSIDLKSLSSEQILIEQYLDINNIIYARKSGDIGKSEDKDYRYKISMEKFGQLLLAVSGFPEKCANQKQIIFGSMYHSLFIENFDLESSVPLIEDYFKITNKYSNIHSINKMEQKYYYILHLIRKYPNRNFELLIEDLEDAIKSYKKTKKSDLQDSRILIKLDFKNYLHKVLDEI
ncbi:AIPR family protein [Photobacterium leiognathi]|uniref:AIPR family protein n=3 Tax=Photobacterium leiognathi TaxID=553611 RepID=UPI0029815551|nr:AIPR family protein [Photobacterium leiognathi]